MKHKKESNRKTDKLTGDSPADSLNSVEMDKHKRTPSNKTETEIQEQTNSKVKKFWISIIDMKVSTFVVALATLGTLLVIFCQLQIMRKQMINSTRAWITLENAFHSSFKIGKRPRIRVIFINSGNSPAVNVTSDTTVGFRNEKIPDPMPRHRLSQDSSKSLIGPQVRHNIEVSLGSPLTQLDIDDINNRKKKLYIWGRIEYDDIFSKHRTTEFCLRSDIETVTLEACENNNTAY